MPTTLPNLLTLSRIGLIPVFVGLLYVEAPWGPWAAAAVFVAAAITDYLDGYLARTRAMGSAFGALLDPIADKMLVAAALLALAVFGRLDGLLLLPALVILLREILITGLREFLAGRGIGSLPVSGLAKWKTMVQLAALSLLIVGEATPPDMPVTVVGAAALWAAAALTVITGVEYVRAGLRHMARPGDDRPG